MDQDHLCRPCIQVSSLGTIYVHKWSSRVIYTTIYVLPRSFLSVHKWSGRTIYVVIDGPGDRLCCHKWSHRTIYAHTIYVMTGHRAGWVYFKGHLKVSSDSACSVKAVDPLTRRRIIRWRNEHILQSIKNCETHAIYV